MIGTDLQVNLCKQICNKTKGEYRVIKNEKHFLDLLMGHVQPPKIMQDKEKDEPAQATFIEMGFPVKYLAFTEEQEQTLSHVPCPWYHFCLLLLTLSHKKLNPPPFCFCPRCKSRQCTLPTTCSVCGLTLVSSSDLSQSYHHLFPVPPFSISVVSDLKE